MQTDTIVWLLILASIFGVVIWWLRILKKR